MKVFVVVSLLLMALLAGIVTAQDTLFEGCLPIASGFNETLASDNNTEVVFVPFAESGITFTVNDIAMTPPGENITLEINGLYEFAVVAANDTPYIAALMRIEQLQTDESTVTLEPAYEGGGDIATSCMAPVVGIERTTQETPPGGNITGRFVSTLADVPVSIDITVVLSNDTGTITYTEAQVDIYIAIPETQAPVAAPAIGTLAPSRTMEPTTTFAPTAENVCYVCGSSDYNVSFVSETIVINNTYATCDYIEQAGMVRAIPADDCVTVTELVIASCGCIDANGTLLAVEATTNATLVPGNDTAGTMNETMPSNGTDVAEGENSTMVPGNGTTVGNETMGNGNTTNVNGTEVGNTTIVPGGETNNNETTTMPPNATGEEEMVNTTTMAPTTAPPVNGTTSMNVTTDDDDNNNNTNTTNAPVRAPTVAAAPSAPVATTDRGASSSMSITTLGQIIVTISIGTFIGVTLWM